MKLLPIVLQEKMRASYQEACAAAKKAHSEPYSASNYIHAAELRRKADELCSLYLESIGSK